MNSTSISFEWDEEALRGKLPMDPILPPRNLSPCTTSLCPGWHSHPQRWNSPLAGGHSRYLAQAFSHLSQDLGCSGLAGHVVVLVDGLGGFISGLSDQRCHGGCVDVGEDAASHPLVLNLSSNASLTVATRAISLGCGRVTRATIHGAPLEHLSYIPTESWDFMKKHLNWQNFRWHI